MKLNDHADVPTILAIYFIKVALFFLFVGIAVLCIYTYKRIFAKQIAKRTHVNKVATEGYLAFQNLQTIDANPYPPGTEDCDFWKRGYGLAQRRKANISS